MTGLREEPGGTSSEHASADGLSHEACSEGRAMGARDTFDELGRSSARSAEVPLPPPQRPAVGWGTEFVDEPRTGDEVGGRYRLGRVIGRGASGTVFEASHSFLGMQVALKCLYSHHLLNETVVARFFQEARIAAMVQHPNVVRVHDGGWEGERLFLAMERLEGESLEDVIRRGPIAVDRAIAVFLQIMSGVEACHAAGVVHRDLKPDNVFLARVPHLDAPIPKVLDFGISKLKESNRRELTAVGSVMGTPSYMAPEQLTSARDVDARADVFSLGVMLYEALVGDVPFPGESAVEIYTAIQAQAAPPVHLAGRGLPSALSAVIAKATRVDREQRHRSVGAFAESLAVVAESLAGGVSPGAEPAPADTLGAPTAASGAGAPADRIRRVELPTVDALRSPDAGMGLAGVASSNDSASGLRPPVRETVPVWVVPALLASGGVALAAVLLALVAILR